MTETTKAPSKEAMEATVAIMRDVFMWEDDWLREPFGRAAIGKIAAALDSFAADEIERVISNDKAVQNIAAGYAAQLKAAADYADALRARNEALVAALTAIIVRPPDDDGLLWLDVKLPDRRGHAGVTFKYPVVAKPPSIVQQVIENWTKLRDAALAADAKAGEDADG